MLENGTNNGDDLDNDAPDALPEVRPVGSLARVNGNWRTKTVAKRR